MVYTPELRTRAQIVGDLIDGFLARVDDVDDFNKGSVINQFFNAIGQSNFRVAADIISMVDGLSVDRVTGEALQRLAADRNVPIYSGDYSTGSVNITDISISKIATQVYVGQPAPVAGTLKIYVVDASKFNAAGGKIYIGRGTSNFEGPLTYATVSQEGGGAYWSITLDSSSPTTGFHSQNEEVVLAQGGRRTITSGSTVSTSQGSVSKVDFTTTETSYIEDGEVLVSGVPIICKEKGEVGNVARGSIKEASGLSFKAVVFNSNALVNGKESDDDEAIRTRIKEYEAAKSKGTESSIQAAAIGVISPDDLKTVRSSSTVREVDGSSTLVFDDGGGYEAIVKGSGYERVISNAIGGETEIQLRNLPVALVRLKTVKVGPFSLYGSEELRVEIQGITKSHIFLSSDFRVVGRATAYEVVGSINGDTEAHFLATTSDGGTRVVIYTKDKTKNDMRVHVVTTDDANELLGFPVTSRGSLLLYRNDNILYQDGISATIPTINKSDWDTSIVNGDTLKYTVDGTPEQTITFINSTFQSIEISSSVSYFTSLEIWVQVFNKMMAGVTAVVSGEFISFSSSKGEDDTASLEFTGGTLLYKIFDPSQILAVEGRASDYTLNKNTGQIALTEPLVSGDKITAGSPYTRAKITTTSMPDGPVTGSDFGKMWFIVDGAVDMYPSGLAGDTQITFSKTLSEIAITATNAFLEPIGFENAQKGDWILAWAETTDSASYKSWQGYWRIKEAQRGRLVVEESEETTRSLSADVFTLPTDRIVLARSPAPIQEFSFGTSPLSDFADELMLQISGIVTTILGASIRISTTTSGESGEIVILAANNLGKSTGVEVSTIFNNIPSHHASLQTLDTEASMPSFTYGEMGQEDSLDMTLFEDPLFESLGGKVGGFIQITNNYTIGSEDLEFVPNNNSGQRVFVRNYNQDSDELELYSPQFMQQQSVRLKEGERFFLRSSYQFDSEDRISVIVDGNTVTGTFGVPVSRKVTVSSGSTPSGSTPTEGSFSASDAESSLDLDDTSSFGSFDFKDFKVWRQASAVLTDGNYSIRINSADFGPSGDGVRVGFVYPTSSNQTELGFEVADSEAIDVGIILPISAPRVANWDGTSTFEVDVVQVGDSKEEATYTWKTGTEPNFLGGGGADVNIGDIAMINSSSDFLSENKGLSAKVTGVTANSFTITLPKGKVVSDSLIFSSISNENGTITINCPNHQVNIGDRIGLFDTAIGTININAPMDQTVYVTSLDPNPNIFKVSTPVGVPGNVPDTINGTSENLIAITSPNHGLAAGDVISVSGFTGAQTIFNGITIVRKLDDINPTGVFYYIKPSTTESANSSGRFDFQSYKTTSGGGAISNIALSAGIVTITASGHSLIIGDIVEVSNVNIPTYVAGAYGIGDIVEFGGSYYSATQTQTSSPWHDPTDSLYWEDVGNLLEGKFVVDTANIGLGEFTYLIDHPVGSIPPSPTPSGQATRYASYGKLSRAIGSNTEFLQFASLETTAQGVVDYIDQSMSHLIGGKILSPSTGAEIIDTSTSDNDLLSGYLSGNIGSYRTTQGSRIVTLEVDVSVMNGSTLTISGVASQYNGTYVVLAVRETVPTVTWEIDIQSAVFAVSSASHVVSGTFIGNTPYQIMSDGENSILSQDLSGDPTFTVKKAWGTAPKIGDEIRLVCVTTDHLTRFWNQLVVTGLSNRALVENNEYGKQVQLTTDTFGALGSVLVTGGKANSATVAIVGSGTERGDRTGVFKVPYDLRKGFYKGSWVRLEQTVKQNKVINLDTETFMQSRSNGFEITAGAGSFQTKRAITHDIDTQFLVEKHGDFTAFIRIGGTTLELGASGVQEGDWVRIKNTVKADYNSAIDYTSTNMVNYGGFTWYCLSNNGPPSTVVLPIPNEEWNLDDTYGTGDSVSYNNKAYRSSTNGNTGNYPNDSIDWELVWEIREWNSGNLGIFRLFVFLEKMPFG